MGDNSIRQLIQNNFPRKNDIRVTISDRGRPCSSRNITAVTFDGNRRTRRYAIKNLLVVQIRRNLINTIFNHGFLKDE